MAVARGRTQRSAPDHPAGLHAPLRELLAGYDREVERALGDARAAATGTARVRVLHNAVRQAVAVHDAVLESALCPLLEDLPTGGVVAESLRRGCRERASLLRRFDQLSRNVAARNVYPVSGEEVEQILDGLRGSFDSHAHDETTRVTEVLEAARPSTDPTVVAARMALEARLAPTAAHGATTRHPRSTTLKWLYREKDRASDWVDAHHGWLDPGAVTASPRSLEVEELQRQAVASPPSIRSILAGYDSTIDALIGELEQAVGPEGRAQAFHRLAAAVTVHDSVLGGVVCPLLEAVPDGQAVASRLREGSHHRAELQRNWRALVRGRSAEDLFQRHDPEVESLVEALVDSFRAHEREADLQVSGLLERLPDEAFRSRLSPFEDALWPWKSEGPAVLALRMALWAESAPTRVHPLLVRYPSSRVLKTLFYLVDRVGDSWRESALERWLFPRVPRRPFTASQPTASRPTVTQPTASRPEGAGGRPGPGPEPEGGAPPPG